MSSQVEVEWYYVSRPGHACKRVGDSGSRVYSKLQELEWSLECEVGVLFRGTMADPEELDGGFHPEVNGTSTVAHLKNFPKGTIRNVRVETSVPGKPTVVNELFSRGIFGPC